VLLKELSKFILKRPFLVMRFLILNICNRRVHLGHPNAECTIPFLPGKISMVEKILMDPNGGTTLDELNGFANANLGGSESRIWTWSSTPPMAKAFASCWRAMPPM
jgi:hypothetical protein